MNGNKPYEGCTNMELTEAKPAVSPRNLHPFYTNKFAWLPIWIYEEGNKHNSATIAFRWLWFVIRDASSIRLEFNFTIDLDRFHIRIGLPYMNIHFMIQFPYAWASWEYKNLYRRGEESRFKWLR